MTASPTPRLSVVADELKTLSTSFPEGSNAIRLKNVLREEIRDSTKCLPSTSAKGSVDICDKVYEAAKQRVIIEEFQQLITEQQILRILSQSPQAIRECYNSAVINKLMIHSNIQYGCVSSQLLIDFLRTYSRRSRQHILVQSVTKSTEFITSNEFVDFVMAEISNKITWEDGMKDYPFYHAVFIERCVFFHLDPQRTGKVSIQDLTYTKVMDDLFEILSEEKRCHDNQGISLTSWCSLNNFWRVLHQFRHCDKSWSGMVSLEECRSIRDGAFTPLFLERVFATQTLYGERECQEMDFRGFLELDIAFRTRSQPASIKWLFRILDLSDDGYLDRGELKMMIDSMLKNMSSLEGWSDYAADDIVDEIFDMLNPSTHDRISLNDMLNSRMAETALGVLIDYPSFLKYEIERLGIERGRERRERASSANDNEWKALLSVGQ
ncbi:Serine/threonine-protein phosphatase 2A regulatory subunit B'' subunit gamma [Parelaphostrongylus tenuis]|uniref:Serine/threonine-protein phosphatase 2A regulatory subunit B'' subunit gamma n=1 Tax=Parelaphostrongylus tenuis TaxID=148309 RepID=A0AAD5QVB8_PARTN|nr:Serine/threonine-protein phosphatase 2A regulatory subunit B'' subunit gamma [Parelaphostrongylus tenuis]